MDEAESESLACRIARLYRKLHPSDNRTIPSVGEPVRFPNQSAFANWEGMVPGARQSSNVEVKGLRILLASCSILQRSKRMVQPKKMLDILQGVPRQPLRELAQRVGL